MKQKVLLALSFIFIFTVFTSYAYSMGRTTRYAAFSYVLASWDNVHHGRNTPHNGGPGTPPDNGSGLPHHGDPGMPPVDGGWTPNDGPHPGGGGVPEPATLLLILGGASAVGAGYAAKKKQKK